MTNLTISVKNLGHAALALKNNLVIFSYIALGVLLIFEFFVVKQSLSQILDINKPQPPSRTVQKVRVNFADYENNLKRLTDAKSFSSDINIDYSPFKSK